MPVPALPLEIQFAVIEAAEASFDMATDPHRETEDYPKQRRLLWTLCLVSRKWKSIAQPLLLRRISLRYVSRIQLQGLLQTLQANAALRSCVKQLAGFDARQEVLLDHLHLFPNLSAVSNLDIDPCMLPVAPAGHNRLRLRSLAVFNAKVELHDLDEPTISWFNLDSLELFAFYGSWVEGDLVLYHLLAYMPDSLRHVHLLGLEPALLEPALTALSQSSRGLISLAVGPTSTLALMLANPLGLFPDLRQLEVRMAHSLSPLLGVSHKSLAKLAFGFHSPFDALVGYLPSDPLRQFVVDLCMAQRPSPPPLTALKVVALTEGRVAFARPFARKTPGLREMARELRSVGLRFEDAYGHAWRDEWSDEAEGADA